MLAELLISAILFQVTLSSDEIEGRVIGGQTVSIESIPYQAGVFFGEYMCGGSILSNKIILTAAHCTERTAYERQTAFVRAGSSFWHSGGQVSFIKNIYDHERYNGYANGFDISILELETSLTFDSGVISINIASYPRTSGAIATASGWGLTKRGDQSSVSSQLQFVNVPFKTTQDCRQLTFYNQVKIKDGMVCAGYDYNEGFNTCQGDSGGALVNNGEVIGVVSWATSCALAGYPTVFTDVYYFRNWIDEKIDLINRILPY